MPIRNKGELVEAVAKASRLLQEIHEYCGPVRKPEAKVKFPRGLIRSAGHYRALRPGYMNSGSPLAALTFHVP